MADLDRLIREVNPEPGQPRVPVPQYQKIGGVGYEKVTGQHGGAHAVLLGPNGQPISLSNRLPVEVTGNVGVTGDVAANIQLIKDAQGRLYGYDGTAWRAVKVNSGGQLELAQEIVIDNVTVNVGAEVKINNLETEPVPVTLNGSLVSNVNNILSTSVLLSKPTLAFGMDANYASDVTPINSSSHNWKGVHIYNKHNVAINIAVFNYDGLGNRFGALDYFESCPAGAEVFISSDTHPAMAFRSNAYVLYLNCVSTPSSGTIDIRFFGGV